MNATPVRAKPPEFGYRVEDVEAHIGKRIRALREHHLLFQTTTAKLAGVSVSQYRRFEKGKMPRFDQLLKLANIFQVSVLYFAMEAPAPYTIETLGQRFAAGHTAWR